MPDPAKGFGRMQLGIYTAVENGSRMAAASWDFIEENILELLQGELPGEQWTGLQRSAKSPLPVLAANRLLPPHLKPVGPEFDLPRLQKYMQRIADRAAAVGMKILVFGSGAARMVPANFDRASAKSQLLEFIRMSVELLTPRGILLVAEPLNSGECNIMNSVPECMEYVHAVNRPGFQCLVDSYHVWHDHQPLEPIAEAMPWIKHVHVSDVLDRNVPSEKSPHDYRGFFNMLQTAGYDGPIAVESPTDPCVLSGPEKIVEFLLKIWPKT
jgi:sugar phosphate isomerase/epimerase